MSFFDKFGYAIRHEMRFNIKSKRGMLKLWSWYNGTYKPQDPVANGSSSFSEFLAHQGSRAGGNFKTEIPLGEDNDLLFLLAAIYCLKHGKVVSFENYEGRFISLFITQEGKDQIDVYNIKITYNSYAGKLIHKELIMLERILIEKIYRIGYSKEEVIVEVNKRYDQMAKTSK
ncbi:MAG: hypothetical protein JEZ00_09170 [Anaerolineaceae bacterium]|nr:hypothetical protein [Anaerolineaceae bacterium]